MFESIRNWLVSRLQVALGISVKIDDSPGWRSMNGRNLHDRDAAEQDALYTDVLTAWRKNPMAWRTVQITTDYVVGETITISSPDEDMQRFIDAFWSHPKNRMANRLETMCEELTRAGDLFPLLFLNRSDGMSYLRFLTKDQIETIRTKKSDWETETVIVQKSEGIEVNGRNWYTPENGRSKTTKAIILHHSINRPMGAQFGESDLSSIIPWLLRYSRMLEGRIRLHWAARAFLWFVTVPAGKVKEKKEQYDSAPEAGAVIVKDEAEDWDVKSPNLRGTDAAPDMRAVRNMIDAGTGFPPHWRGEATDISFATASAMQEPAERHLIRRQKYFIFILSDILYNAYKRANSAQPQAWPEIRETDYTKLFTANTPDISRSDNEKLANSADKLSTTLTAVSAQYNQSPKLRRLMLKLILKFAGEPQDDKFLDDVMDEAEATIKEPVKEPKSKQNGHMEKMKL